ncbi:MAG TPA: 3-hydroxyacyl-CoA dehydrogenase/enoyl-CoA hydratase family protein [Gemmatimonadales bacterium]|nr:3-hydroxyacyl-CoA dehydrogenase/enoyl-CoA hydratase family protein [Gemmatimonadales bacterium]
MILGVVGAGTMGSGIAALAASAGIPVVLLDIPGEDGSDAPARAGVQRALKARPAAFMHPDRASLIQTGSLASDLPLLAGCDLVIEAIVEKPEPKMELYERLESVLGPQTIIATNTSGIPLHLLTSNRSDGFRRRFIGMHFFNPPRYLHLLEVIPGADTDDDVMSRVRTIAERLLGKGIVVAKDVPGFIANRLGVHGLMLALRLMEKHDLTIGEVDALTGQLIGRPKSATFRTGDITGLDVLQHVARGLSESTGEEFGMPAWVNALVEQGRLGEKSGAGFYQKSGREIRTLDWKTGEYAVREVALPDGISALAGLPLAERLRGLLDLAGTHGDFLRDLLLNSYHYALERAPELAFDLESVDQALEWGYGWELGPVRQMDAIGLDRIRVQMKSLGLEEPALLEQAGTAFRWVKDGEVHTISLDGGTEAVQDRHPPRLTAASLHRAGAVVFESDHAALLDMGEGVLLFETRSRMNTLGAEVVDALHGALDRIEEEGYAGLVIGNDDARTFSAGANLKAVAVAAEAGEWKVLEENIRAFQDTSMRLRGAPFPVVAAPFGLTLGGGCEFSLHCDAVQAHAELYMGLVEVGVGVIPGGGGTKELLFRFTRELAPYAEADPFEAVKRAFQLIALAKTSGSALEARAMGLLRDSDRISMNRDLLLEDARQRVVNLAPDYLPPVPSRITALGNEALGNLRYALWSFREAGQASEHDVRIGEEVALVLAGGEGPPHEVTEQDILDLEREAFLRLLGTRETRERIRHMLETGKPLRN